ncbi:Amino acid transporter, transmembrane domain [Dillenia turbinata]|uniref:Amino acid transporter, transmembrane domain n=1 Tax=Dillenia turbinata TaxID=194707 RepID=A0AAN8VF63_9MAGN
MSPAATQPLLKTTTSSSDFKSSAPERRPSISYAVFNVSTTIIGAGIMSIPATLKVLGLFPACFLIVGLAVLADVSAEFLMRYTRSGEMTTYAGVMRASFGKLGSASVQICVLISNLGTLIIYLIIIGDVLSGNVHDGSLHLGVLQEWFGFHWWNSRAFALLIVLIFVLLPLTLFKRVESLGFSSGISILLAVVFVGIASGMAIWAVVEGKAESPRLLPEIDSHASFFDLFTAFPVLVLAFTFHFNVHPIGFELGSPSDMTKAVRISLVLCAAIYFAIGFFGYLLFGESTMADILVNFDRTSDTAFGALLNDMVRLSYALHLMLVFPLLNFALRANIDELLFSGRPLLAKDNTRFVSLTLALLAFSYVAAIAIPNIWAFFQFIGSTSAVCLAFIFPGAIVLRDVQGISTTRDRIMAAVMVIVAVATSTIAISANLYSLLGNRS